MSAENTNPAPIAEQLKQLDAARLLVLQDAVYWPQILKGVLPIISASRVELRRWGAAFLAESFATPMLTPETKQELAKDCLDTLIMLVAETECEILKSVAQCSASVYPIIFKLICKDPREAAVWHKMNFIKSALLALWDTASVGVRMCCIKFALRVIQVQTPGATDPRLIDRGDISIKLMPSNHPLQLLGALEAEGQALLDRVLGVLQQQPSDPILISATLNGVALLLKTRATVSAQIINSIVQYNPFSNLTAAESSLQDKIMARSLEKTVRILLLNFYRSNPNGPSASRISQYLTRLAQTKTALQQEEASRKRGLSSSATTESAKRTKTADVVSMPLSVPTPPPPAPIVTGPMTYGSVFTLTPDAALSNFDATQLPIDIATKIVVATLYSVNETVLATAISAVKERLVAVANLPPSKIQATEPAVAAPEVKETSPQTVTEQPKADTEVVPQIAEPSSTVDLPQPAVALPVPEALSEEDVISAGRATVDKLFETANHFDKTSLAQRKNKVGLNRVAVSQWDREGWVTMVSRLSTRGMDSVFSSLKREGEDDAISRELSQYVRGSLFRYVTEDWRSRLDIIVAWLNEEWYNDRLLQSQGVSGREPQYPIWTKKVINAIFPYLEAKDTSVMRLLSEIPELSLDAFPKIKMLCIDPDKATLGIRIIHYLYLFKPPLKATCVELLWDLWENNPELKPQLQKFKFLKTPAIVQQSAEIVMAEIKPNVKSEPDIKQEPTATPS